jgi:Major Facilitator Superfamily
MRSQLFCELYYIPLFLETVKNLSPTLAGVGMIPITCALVPVSVIVGAMITRLGRFRWAIWTGWAFTITATGLLILLDQKIKTASWVILFIFVGLGHGLVLMSLNFCIQALADSRDVGYAAAMYTFLRTFGMCIGVAIGGTVFQNRLASHLADLKLPTEVAKNAEAFVSTLKSLPLQSTQRMAYTAAYGSSFKNMFEVLVGIASLGGILSLFIGHASMDKPLDSEHVFKRNETTKIDMEQRRTSV